MTKRANYIGTHSIKNNGWQLALAKLKQKNLDAIVLNSLNDKGAGISGNTNKVTFIDKEERNTPFEMKPKSDVAIDIMNEILKKIDA